MARRRGQRDGWLRAENGSWLLTYRMYAWDPEKRKSVGKRLTVRIGAAPGEGKKAKNGELTEKQAERLCWEKHLSKLDGTTIQPFSTMTIEQFWEQRYRKHLDLKKKYATQTQYKSLWKVWIEPAIGRLRLFELRPDDVDTIIRNAIDAKKGSATAKHIKKVVSAMVEHARTLQMFTGENPAQLVEMPENVPVRRRRALTVEQCRQWLAAVTDEPADPKDKRSDIKPLRTMSLLGICCALGVSEQLGLRWQHVNLTDQAVMVGAEYIEPLSLAIVEHCYHGRQGSLKTGHRRRSVPLPGILVDALKKLRKTSSGPEDAVFAGVSGKPIWADNLAKRSLKPAAVALEMPWLSWHIFRHTCATLTKGRMMDVDRRVLMGHAERDMTDHYTHEDWERMRVGVELLASEVTQAPKGPEPEVLPENVIVMRRAG